MKYYQPIILSILLLFISNLALSQTKNSLNDGRTINIPVVFHIIYSDKTYTLSDGKPHQNENIPDEAILRELKDLNLDFRMKNDLSFVEEEFKNIIGNPNINFHIADTILQEGGSKGIIRKLHPTGTKFMTKVSPLVKKDKYLNVYIGNKGNVTNLNGGWINLNFSQIGENTHVLTHETGHWLGLYHIWAKVGSCSRFKNFFAKKDDGIDDTPPQKRCSDLSRKSCPPKNRAVKKGTKANWNNFMDYSACRCMFTEKQAIKMRNNIIEKRLELFNNSNL